MPSSWLHTPLGVGEIHAQQDTLLFVTEGGDNDQIPDSDRADGLQLHRLHDRTRAAGRQRMCETERRQKRRGPQQFMYFICNMLQYDITLQTK